MALVPHERSLVKRMEGRPFVLLGVNVDQTRDLQKRAEEQSKIPWRSWWDGARGPIAGVWAVDLLPTFVLIDAHGVVRLREVDPDDLDHLVEQLVKEAEEETGKAAADQTPGGAG